MIPFKDILIAGYFDVSVKEDVLRLLPFGHARHYPLEFTLPEKKIVLGQLNFYNRKLYDNFRVDKFIDASKCTISSGESSSNRLIIINTLDNCFGHSLLKLFYAIKYIQAHKNEFDVLLIVPRSLAHFVKLKTGIHLLSIHLSFAALEDCAIINRVIEPLTGSYKKVFLQGGDTYGSFDPLTLKRELELFGPSYTHKAKNKIVFYYRADYARRWSGFRQKTNVIRLFSFLRTYFTDDVRFYIAGDRDHEKFPDWIIDARTSGFGAETDFKNNALLSESLICIGLTGSHMLLPSLLCDCTVHLHPTYKYKNMAEDIVVNEHSYEMLSAYRHLYYFGNYDCSDLTPEKLGNLVLIHFQGLLEKEFKMQHAGESQSEWIKANYPFFNHDLVSAYRTRLNQRSFRRMVLAERVARLLKFMKR